MNLINVLLKRCRVTVFLLITSVLVTLFSSFGANNPMVAALRFSLIPTGMPDILNGEIWRLVTPIFLHFSVLHIVFNMLWLFQLGTLVELSQGMKRMLIIVLATAILPNIGEYLYIAWQIFGSLSEPAGFDKSLYRVWPVFGGMSGVVYGLLGYVWMQGRFNPAAGIGLPMQIVYMMLIWFVVCWAGLVGNIANMAHTVGLVVGIAIGFVYTPKFRRLFR